MTTLYPKHSMRSVHDSRAAKHNRHLVADLDARPGPLWHHLADSLFLAIKLYGHIASSQSTTTPTITRAQFELLVIVALGMIMGIHILPAARHQFSDFFRHLNLVRPAAAGAVSGFWPWVTPILPQAVSRRAVIQVSLVPRQSSHRLPVHVAQQRQATSLSSCDIGVRVHDDDGFPASAAQSQMPYITFCGGRGNASGC